MPSHPTLAVFVTALLTTSPGCALLNDPNEVALNQSDASGEVVDMSPAADTRPTVDEGPNSDPTDMPPSTTDMPARPDCQAQVLAANLQIEWTTPNTMYVTWDRTNPDVEVQEYEMLVGRTSVDVEDEVNVRLYTADDNGEFRRTTGEFPVDWTTAWGLEPERDYFVKLLAYDTDGCHSQSNIASGTTKPDVSNEHVIFSESPTAGFSVPAGVTFSNRHPYDGQFHYEWNADCGAEASCVDIVRRGGFRQPIQAVDDAAFTGAFLEYAWHNEGSLWAQYPAVRFALYDEDADSNTWWKAERRAPTGPSKDYRLFQVPLSFFSPEGGDNTMTAADLTGMVSEFGVAANNEAGTYLNWDEVRIRW